MGTIASAVNVIIGKEADNVKAAQINQYGNAGMVTVVDVDKPSVGTDQVLIEVYAASINPFDTKVREGYVQQMIPLKLPVTLGGDFAGVVSEVGTSVGNVAVGDKVYGQASAVSGASGAFAEFAMTAAKQVSTMPSTITFAEAGALPLTGLSALQVITGRIKLQPGQRILIHGGAGGIGTIAIQIAKHIGAYVAVTATDEGAHYAQQLGADEVIDYKTQAFDTLLHDYDAVFDTVGGETYRRSLSVLKPNGIIVSMNEQPNTALLEQYGVKAIAQQTRATTESLDALTTLVEEGVVTAHVGKTYPLDQIVEAFKAREAGGIIGKVVIVVKQDGP